MYSTILACPSCRSLFFFNFQPLLFNTSVCRQRQPDDCIRMTKIYDILSEYASYGVVQFMRPPQYITRAQPANQYSDMLLQLQINFLHNYRHFIFMTGMIAIYYLLGSFTTKWFSFNLCGDV